MFLILKQLWSLYIFDAWSDSITPSIDWCTGNCKAVTVILIHLLAQDLYKKIDFWLDSNFQNIQTSLNWKYAITVKAVQFFELELLS